MLINLRIITLPIILFFFLSAIFDPQGGMYGIKSIALLLTASILAINVLILSNIQINKVQLLFTSWFCLFLPIYGIFLAIIRQDGFADFIDTSYIGASILFLYTFLYNNQNIKDSIYIFVVAIRVLAFLIVGVLLFSFFSFSFNPVWFFVEHDSAFFGFRSIGPIQAYYIYFIASPWLMFLYLHDYIKLINKGSFFNLFFYCIILLALILTGNRMNALLVIFSLIFLPHFLISNFYLRIIIYLVISLIISILIFLNITTLVDFIQQIFGSDTRLHYFLKYVSIFDINADFIFGQGFNAHTWSTDFLALVNPDLSSVHASKVELTYLEFIRVFGIINFFIFISFLFYILKELWKADLKEKWLFYGLLFYLAGSFSNPNLFSIVGMIPLGLAFAYVRLNKRLMTSLN